ncbi:MAG: ribonuclease E/G [Clostridiales bacterium]|nr:ribonuclease E/G [Clostridiales bacterium]
MSKQILLEQKDGRREIALMENGKLLAFSREKDAAIEAEQIYLGIVDRIVKGMEAAFVRLGKDHVGFLPFSECKARPRSGDKILLQVKRPPVGEKAAYLSCDISLAGRLAILTPFSQRFSVSKRIENEEERKKLLAIAKNLSPEQMGLVMRQESAGASEAEISNEIEALSQRWQHIWAASSSCTAPCLIQEREDALLRLLRDERGEMDQLITNAPDQLPSLSLPVSFCENPFAIYNIASKLEKSFQRKVWLDCGGFLVIDRTEAMTVIDVNSGKYTGLKSGTEQSFLKLNLEAAREIARLLRLRNIGGIIIIDFVDMQEEESRSLVAAAMQEALLQDPVKSVIHGFTSLGLMEMTRKKTEVSSSAFTHCPHCRGTGYIEEKL